MYEGVKNNAAAALEVEREKVLANSQVQTLPNHYRQLVVATVFDVASTWAKQNNRFPIESDLTALAKSLMAVISVVESDR